MKKTEKKVLRGKLLTAVSKVLRDNKDDIKKKTLKAINKSIKQIVKKTDKKKKVATIQRGNSSQRASTRTEAKN